MKKFLLALALLASPAMAEPTKGWYTHDARGCMMMRECTKGVIQINSIADLSNYYGDLAFGARIAGNLLDG